ncbi:MAG: hypothetical protein M1834_004426 [Cirrosporium novae-zelandiae]|nr:MAG: hypothetical protein M1834_004426 [Cirrosporium novae-zelandiae]
MAISRLLLSFLRPLPPPRLSLFRYVFRPISTSSIARNQAAATKTPNPTPTPAPIDYTASNPLRPESPFYQYDLPYFVRRSKMQNLPVYIVLKRGGNLKMTHVRKIEGDAADLKKRLQGHLGVPDKDIAINPTNKDIIIKGEFKEEIKNFLLAQKF